MSGIQTADGGTDSGEGRRVLASARRRRGPDRLSSPRGRRHSPGGLISARALPRPLPYDRNRRDGAGGSANDERRTDGRRSNTSRDLRRIARSSYGNHAGGRKDLSRIAEHRRHRRAAGNAGGGWRLGGMAGTGDDR